MAAVAPQLVEDLFGTKVFTIIFTIRDSGNTTDRTDAGYLEVTANTNAVITGNTTNSLTIVGTQSECNTAMASLNYVPSADFTESVGVSYSQNDNQGTPEFTDFMLMSIRDSHDDYVVNGPFAYNEDTPLIFTPGQITDLRPDNVDANIQYEINLTLSDPLAGALSVSSASGQKALVNNTLTDITFTPNADYTGDFSITYTQQQTTDNILQANELINVVNTQNSVEFGVETELFYATNIAQQITPGWITDLRPDNVDANIQYEINLTLSDPAAGTLSDNQITGTKAEVNARLDTLLFTPTAEYNSDISITYEQSQSNDSIDQGLAIIPMTNVPKEILWNEVSKENGGNFHINDSDNTGNVFLMVADGGYAYRSDDVGITWTLLDRFAGGSGNPNLYSVALQDDGICILGGENGYGWRSTNYGVTWSSLPRGGLDQFGNSIGVSSIATNNAGVFMTASVNPNGDLSRSINGGITWETLTSSIGTGEGEQVYFYDNEWFVSQGGVHVSNDNGDTWVTRTSTTFTQMVGAPNGTMVAITDGRIYRSTDKFETQDIVAVASVRALTTDNNGNWFATASTPGSMYISNDDGTNWTETTLVSSDLLPSARTIISNKGTILLTGHEFGQISRSPNDTYEDV